MLPLVLPLWSSLAACCGSGSSLWSLSAFFPHAVTTVACFLSSSMFFRLLRFWLSLTVSSPFSVCCVSFCSLVVFPVFPHLTTPPALPFCRASGCLPCCGFFFGCTPVVRKLLYMLSAGFLSPNFSVCFVLLPYPSGCSPLVSVPPSACCGVMRSGFGSFSAVSALLCCCRFCF